MNALIDVTSNVSSNLLNATKEKENLINLFKQKIEEILTTNEYIIVVMSNLAMECRKIIYSDNIECDGNDVYLNRGDYTLHMDLNLTEIVHDDSCIDASDVFTFTYNNTKIIMYFLD